MKARKKSNQTKLPLISMETRRESRNKCFNKGYEKFLTIPDSYFEIRCAWRVFVEDRLRN